MRFCCLLLLLLSGCGSKGGEGQGTPANGGSAGAGAPAAVAASQLAPHLEELTRRAMAAALPRAADIRYRNLRAGSNGTVCGEVSPAELTGAAAPFRPFVVTPDAVAILGNPSGIAFDDPSDPIADMWIEWCATPEELTRLGPALERAATAPAPPAEDIPPSDEVTLAPPPSELPPPPEPSSGSGAAAADARPRAADRPPPPPQIDSFFNSVDRDRQ